MKEKYKRFQKDLFNLLSYQKSTTPATFASLWTETAHTELEQVVRTHRTSYRSGYPTGFGELNPNPHALLEYSPPSWWVQVLCPLHSLPLRLEYLFTPPCPPPPTKSDKNLSIRVTIHFLDRVEHLPALSHRNRSEITVRLCKQRPYRILFSCRRKDYPLWLENDNNNKDLSTRKGNNKI